MARGARPRPPPFPQGTNIGEHFRVEALVRLAEGRMFYLLNDDRPDRETHMCWECGAEDTPRSAHTCSQCGASLENRRFLMSARWASDHFAAYQKFYELNIRHPGILHPIAVFQQDAVLCSVIPYHGESLLLDECSPLSTDALMSLTQRALGLLAFLQQRGIELVRLTPANFLIDANRRVLLCDIDVKSVSTEPLTASVQQEAVQQLIRVIRRYAAVNFVPFWEFVHEVEAGNYADTESLGDGLLEVFPVAEESPPPPHPAAAITDVGLIRDLNEDNWDWVRLGPDIFLYVVADGMGGHDSGEVASELAARTLCRVARDRAQNVKEFSAELLENILDEAFQTANNTIKDDAERRHNDMGTTLVAMLCIRNQMSLIANVGDSRAYLLRDKVLHKVTRDHSLVQRMVEQKRITEEEARNHPHSNILLRTVGTERNVEIDIYAVEVEPNDKVLLCSDGLWGEVDDEDMEAILNHYQDLRTSSRELVRAAHHGGGRDNITLVVVETR